MAAEEGAVYGRHPAKSADGVGGFARSGALAASDQRKVRVGIRTALLYSHIRV